MPMVPARPQVPAIMGDPAGVYATAVSPVRAQVWAAGVAARACRVVRVAQRVAGPGGRDLLVAAERDQVAVRGGGESVRDVREGPEAGGTVAQVLPPSPVVVIAEKVRDRLGRSPTTMPPPACPARMSAPLVAMSGGVAGTTGCRRTGA